MGTKRTQPTGRKDVLGREIKVNGDTATLARADAPPPADLDADVRAAAADVESSEPNKRSDRIAAFQERVEQRRQARAAQLQAEWPAHREQLRAAVAEYERSVATFRTRAAELYPCPQIAEAAEKVSEAGFRLDAGLYRLGGLLPFRGDDDDWVNDDDRAEIDAANQLVAPDGSWPRIAAVSTLIREKADAGVVLNQPDDEIRAAIREALRRRRPAA